MKRWYKIGGAVLCLFIIFSLFGYFLAPPLLKNYLLGTLSEYLGRKVTIASITINPYLLSASIRGIQVTERGRPDALFSADELFLDFAGISSDRKHLVFEQVRLTRPYLSIVREDNNSYNISDIITKRAEGGVEAQAFPFHWILTGLSIVDGAIDFLDGPNRTKHSIAELNVNLPFFSTAPRHQATDINPSLTMKVDGAPYKVSGTTKPFTDTMETTLDVEIRDLALPHYLAYVPLGPRFKVEKGVADATIRLTYARYKDQPPALAIAGDVEVRNLVIREGAGGPVLQLAGLELAVRSAEPFADLFRIERVTVRSPSLNMVRDESGAMNVDALFGNATTEGRAAGGQPKASATPATARAIDLVVEKVELDDGSFSFADALPLEEARFVAEKVELRAENVSLGKNQKGTFSLACLVNRGGQIRIKGDGGLDPTTVTATVDVENVDIVPFQPYFFEVLNMDVTGGSISLAGDAVVSSAGSGKPAGRFAGTASLNGFASIDQVNGDDLLKWGSLFLRKVSMNLHPLQVAVEGVALSDFYARIIVHPDRTLNVQQLFATGGDGGAPGPEPATPQPPERRESAQQEQETKPVIKVDAITLQDGTIDFEDRSIKPKVYLHMDELAGRLSGLSSETGEAAEVDVKGRVGEVAPLEITGKINPFSPDLYMDLKGKVQGVELTAASPYSGKYLGYGIEKGKLSLDIEYLINKKKLDSQNRVFLDQLTLGDRVESPDATKLPVKLAITLLTDRSGRIELDIPVQGNLDDPQFSVWKIVWKIVGNLLVKAATSPFALLGSLFGGGEELGYVEFDYGSDAVGPADAEKLKKLAGALKERPGLRLDIEGHVDPERDRSGLKERIFTRKVAAQKLKDLAKAGGTTPKLENVTVEQGEYEKYLRLAYKAEKFTKPRNFIGLEKTLPAGEMEKLMMTHIEVTDGDLRLLASARSSEVREEIVAAGGVEPQRIFIVEPKSLVAEPKENVKASRVDFRLQ